MKAKTIAYIKDGHVKLFMEEPASPMWEASELVLRHEAQAEIDAFKAENAELHAECDRLTTLLQYEEGRRTRIGTHGPECWKWGPAHYECAVREIERLKAMLGPQKVLSTDDVTEEEWYWWRHDKSREWELNYFYMVDIDRSLVGQFIGPIKIPEVTI